MQLERARQYIFDRLGNELPEQLCYHNLQHTKDVLEKCMEIAHDENLNDEHDLKLLQTAALYHDSGFIYVYDNHEEEGCLIARQVLPGFGYSQQDIDTICNMIMKTKLPQKPETHLERILCDADLDHLGRDDFHEVGDKLYREWAAMSKKLSEREWNEIQVQFLETHHFWTKTSTKKRAEKKAENLKGLKEKLYC
jgi:uncharacterized protein